MSTDSKSSKPQRVLLAPPPSAPGLYSTVLNVVCGENEDVEWHWTETREGRFVSGYSIVPRITPTH